MQYDFCPPTGSLKVDGATDALQVRCRWWDSVHVCDRVPTIFMRLRIMHRPDLIFLRCHCASVPLFQVINSVRSEFAFDLIALTQDWHPSNHMSFWENNKADPKAKLFEVYDMPRVGEQMMWPVHCVQGTPGAEFHADLKRAPTDVVVQKGTNSGIDSYSGFFDNDHKNQTEMNNVLRKNGVCLCFELHVVLVI